MNKPLSTLEKIEQLFHKGDLKQAKQLCSELIEQNPNNADALHALGIIYASIDELEEAKDYFQQAIYLQPDNPRFHNHLANVLKQLQAWKPAEKAYLSALQLEPDFAEAHNNLANLYAQQDNLHKAMQHYIRAVHLKPDYVQAHQNLGMLLLRQNKIEEAKVQFNNVIAIDPNMKQAHYYLGTLYLQQKKINEARQHFEAVLRLQPNHIEALNNFGVTLLQCGELYPALQQFDKILKIDPQHHDGRSNLAATFLLLDRYEDAMKHYEIALEASPDNPDFHYNLGVALMSLGQLKKAIEHFEKTITLNVKHVDAYANLGACFQKIGQKEKAMYYYYQGLKLQPTNPSLQYIYKALAGNIPKDELPFTAPLDYVKHLFDNYAMLFDQHLLNELHYQSHRLLYQAIRALPGPDKNCHILDLGCGTGLSGELFRQRASHLVGVDISPKMIAKAKEKKLYDDYIVQDIHSFLKQVSSDPPWDIIIAADVFVYIGKLDDIIQECHRILKPRGLLAFTTEILEKDNPAHYYLNQTGRYAHQKAYLTTLAEQTGFTIEKYNTVVGRIQDEKPVPCYLCVLRKNLP